jgi:rhamnogalacturonyl hydrolase YesR
VTNALLDLYEASHEARYLSMAVSAAEYILNELYWTEDNSVACFSYPVPSSRSQVHNANFLGAALLCRVYKHSSERKFLEPALKVARYSAGKQRADGSWHYGGSPTQRWVDNFHTGYNLCALRRIGQEAETGEFNRHISRGFEFYREHFFREDGAPKYFHDRTYPLDVHSVAQSIITLLELKDLDEANITLAHSVFKWAITNLWDERGYFYHQKLGYGTIKIPYMRWGQAWMLLALATLLEDGCDNQLAEASIRTARLQEAVR